MSRCQKTSHHVQPCSCLTKGHYSLRLGAIGGQPEAPRYDKGLWPCLYSSMDLDRQAGTKGQRSEDVGASHNADNLSLVVHDGNTVHLVLRNTGHGCHKVSGAQTHRTWVSLTTQDMGVKLCQAPLASIARENTGLPSRWCYQLLQLQTDIDTTSRGNRNSSASGCVPANYLSLLLLGCNDEGQVAHDDSRAES